MLNFISKHRLRIAVIIMSVFAVTWIASLYSGLTRAEPVNPMQDTFDRLETADVEFRREFARHHLELAGISGTERAGTAVSSDEPEETQDPDDTPEITEEDAQPDTQIEVPEPELEPEPEPEPELADNTEQPQTEDAAVGAATPDAEPDVEAQGGSGGDSVDDTSEENGENADGDGGSGEGTGGRDIVIGGDDGLPPGGEDEEEPGEDEDDIPAGEKGPEPGGEDDEPPAEENELPGDEEPEEEPEEEEPEEEEEITEPTLVTDLGLYTGGTISIPFDKDTTDGDIIDHILQFYAYIAYPDDYEGPSCYLKLELMHTDKEYNRHDKTYGLLYTGESHSNETELYYGLNTFTVHMMVSGGGVYGTYVFSVNYEPEKHEYPPVIYASFDDEGYPDIEALYGEETSDGRMGADYQFWVTAKAYNETTGQYDKPLNLSHITVWADEDTEGTLKQIAGNRFTNGQTRPQCNFWVKGPTEGDERVFTVRVKAQDDEGNVAERLYTVGYKSGIEGSAYIYIDATVVGLCDPGYYLEDPYEYELKDGRYASYAVVQALEDMGYSADYTGRLDTGFYLRAISRTNLTRFAEVRNELWQILLNDGDVETDGRTKPNDGRLGEFDFTNKSGWMYRDQSENGSAAYVPTLGLSEYPLKPGDKLFLIFTLALGKDIGTYDGTGYCLTYSADEMYENHMYINNHCICCGMEAPNSGGGDNEGPGVGDNETPGDGDNETPGGGDNETPGGGDNETPGGGDNETPGGGDNETPGDGDNETPGDGDNETPGDGDNETPGDGDNETPGDGDSGGGDAGGDE